MRPEEANDLAVRISQTWRTGAPASVWEEELIDLDAGRAGTAFARLRRESTRAPSIAEFYDLYRSLSVTDGSHTRAECDACDGSGWVDSVPLVRQYRDRQIEYSQMRPCKCETGLAMSRSSASGQRA